MSKATLTAARRRTDRPSDLKKLRSGGYVPAVLYGFGNEAEKIQIEQSVLRPVLKKAHGSTLLIDVTVDGEKAPVTTVIREVQRHPVSREILHCDLLRVDMKRKYHVTVPIVLRGEPVGVKTHGGVLDQQLREIDIRCLPGEIPEHYEIDVSEMMIGDSVHVNQIPHGNEEFLTPGDVSVIAVAAPRKLTVEEEAAEAAAAGVVAEGVEGAEGAAEEKPGEKAKAGSS